MPTAMSIPKKKSFVTVVTAPELVLPPSFMPCPFRVHTDLTVIEATFDGKPWSAIFTWTADGQGDCRHWFSPEAMERLVEKRFLARMYRRR